MDAVDNENYAEGKKFNFLGEEAIDPEQLKIFDHPSKYQYIKTVSHEFAAVCPFSGLPDLATVVIEYRPLWGLAVELKSLKYYFLSFRNVGIYQEGVTKRIHKDFFKAISREDEKYSNQFPPTERFLRVTTHYHVRGGFYTTCVEGDIWNIPDISYPDKF